MNVSRVIRGPVMDRVYQRAPEKLKYFDYSSERKSTGMGMKVLTGLFFLTFYIDNRHDTRNSGIATRIFGHASFF
jgi:hypothetical protein